MSSNEEYLDSLLQTLLEEETEQKNVAVEGSEVKESDDRMENQEEISENSEINDISLPEDTALQEENPVEIPDISVENDANHKMSAEEIEAMFAALEAEDNSTADSENASDNIMAQMQDEPIDFFAQEEEQPDEMQEDAVNAPDFGIDEEMMSLLNGAAQEESIKEENDSEFDFFAMEDAAMPQEQDLSDDFTSLPGDSDAGMTDLDITKLLEKAEAEQLQQEEVIPENPESPDKAKQTGKKKKEKKVKPPKADKKPGFFSRLFTTLVKEEDEEETAGNESIDGYNMDAENKSVMEALDEAPGGKVKAKKEKKKKEKKPAKEKTPKEKKEKKPKKEKMPAKEKEPKAPAPKGRPLPKKRIAAIAAMGATVLAAILLLTLYIPEMMERHQAAAAYQDENYEEAFYLLQGKALKGAEKDTYRRTILILQLERQLESYENYLKMDMQLEALNALVKGVDKYQKGLDAAQQYGVAGEMTERYQQMKDILEKEYGLTEAAVEDILSQKDDVYYTVSLKQALGQPAPEVGASEAEQPVEEPSEAEQTDAEQLPEEALLEQ